MDIVIEIEDEHFFDWFYKTVSPGGTWLDRGDPQRQFWSIYLTVMVQGSLLYFFLSGIDWFFFFDKTYLKHPKFLKNQVFREILTTVGSIPVMSFLTAIIFWYEVNGYSELYDGFANGVAYEVLTMALFLVFTDFCIYWIHRALHHPLLYGPIHKQHHLWKVPTPWASHAFHPLDGFAQSTPYHIFAFLWPMNKLVYLGMFVFVNIWTISIHDGNFVSKDGILNSAGHHAEHHLKFTCNYGQYFTWWDRLFGTHRQPDFEELNPKAAIKAAAEPAGNLKVKAG